MADIPEVADELPLPAEYDDRALDMILDSYNIEQIPRVGLSVFRSRYLPLLAKQHPREVDIDAVRAMWVAEVAQTYRLPVFVVDDADPEKMVYRVPPLVGSVNTAITGHEYSMNSLDKKEEALKGRFSRQADNFREQKYNAFAAHDHVNRLYQLDWITIMVNEGYLVELKETIGDGPYPDHVAAIIGDKLDKIDLTKPTDNTLPLHQGGSASSIGLLDEDEEYEDDDE